MPSVLSALKEPRLHFFRTRAALCFTVVVIATFLLLIWILPNRDQELSAWVTEVFRQYSLVSSTDQRKAYLIAVLLTGTLALLALLMNKRGLLATQAAFRGPSLNFSLAIGLIAIGIYVYSWRVLPWTTGWACALGATVLLLTMAAPSISTSTLYRTSIALIAAYLVILIVPGLLARPIALMENDPVALSQFEQHLLLLTMPGSALSAGQNYFGDLPYSYGLVFPSIMSIVDRYVGQLSIGDQLQFVQYSQLVFSVAAVAAYLAYAPRNPFGVLVAILLAGPFWATGGLGIWHPNQTGFRSDGFPIGLLVLALLIVTRPSCSAWILGAVAGITILSNFETGVMLSLGYVVFLLLRTQRFPIALYVKCAAAGSGAILAYLVLYSWALGRFPFARSISGLYLYLERYLSGGFGLRLFSAGEYNVNYFIVPFALCMLAHAVYLVIDGFRAYADGPLPPRRAFRVAVSTVLIAWFAYYFAAPNWWQIWTHLFLYGFLLIDLFDRRYFGIGVASASFGTRLIRARIAAPRLVVLFLLLLFIPETSHRLNMYTQNFVFPTWSRGQHEAVVVSNVLMPKVLGDGLLAKARKLTEFNAATGGRVAYLTFNMAFMPAMTRLFEPDPYRDLWVGTPGDQAFDGIMQRLIGQRLPVILIDTPTGPLAVTGARKDFQDRIRKSVGAAYELKATTDGWQVWQPKAQ